MNDTFLNTATENVKLKCYQVLVRRVREGQLGSGVLVFVFDEYAFRITLIEKS